MRKYNIIFIFLIFSIINSLCINFTHANFLAQVPYIYGLSSNHSEDDSLLLILAIIYVGAQISLLILVEKARSSTEPSQLIKSIFVLLICIVFPLSFLLFFFNYAFATYFLLISLGIWGIILIFSTLIRAHYLSDHLKGVILSAGVFGTFITLLFLDIFIALIFFTSSIGLWVLIYTLIIIVRKIGDQKKKKETRKKSEAKTFEGIMKKAKELFKIGKDASSKKSYKNAIDHWKEALLTYDYALEKTKLKDKISKIVETQDKLRIYIVDAFVKSGELYDNNAQKAYEKGELLKAENDSNSAKNEIQNAIDFIGVENIKIDIRDLKNKIDLIEKRIDNLRAEKELIGIKKEINGARLIESEDLTGAQKKVRDSLLEYKKILDKVKSNSDLVQKIQKAIKEANKYQSKLEKKFNELIGDIPPIEKVKVFKTEKAEVSYEDSKDVEIKRGMDFVGGLIRFKVAIRNDSPTSISNVDVSLQKMAEHIRIIDIQPRVYRKGNRAILPNMSPKQSVSVDFYLEPMICGNIPVTPMITYLDTFGEPEMISKEPLNVNSKCPLIINSNERNIARVENIFSSDNIIKAFRTFELKHNPNEVFGFLIDSISSWAGSQVSKPVIKSYNPYIAETFFFILNQNEDPILGHQEQIILKLRIDETKGVGQIFVGAEKNPTVNGVLTHIWSLVNEEYFKEFKEKIPSLHCPFCGTSINCIDISLDSFECEFCKVKCEKKELIT